MYKQIYLGLFLVSWIAAASAAVVGKPVEYSDGEITMKGFLAFDDAVKEKRPGVLVVHEWWGHNDYARDRANQLAKLGYVALAVDMYGEGKQAGHVHDAKKFSSEVSSNIELEKTRFNAALKFLQTQAAVDVNRVAAIGYCFGGAVVLQMAREGLPLSAVASFHGSLATAQPAQFGKIKARLFVAHGGADPFVKPEQVIGFIDEMNKAGAGYRLHVYSGALHAFTNPAADEYGKQFNLPLKYDRAADVESWGALQRFLKDAFEQRS